MRKQTKTTTLAALSLCFLGCAPPPTVEEEHAAQYTAGSLFDAFQSLEDALPLPNGLSMVNVATCDASTGKFTGLASHWTYIIDPETHKPVKDDLIAPVATIDGVRANLTFHVGNRAGQTATLFINNQQVVVAAADTLSWDVGRQHHVTWSVHVGTHICGDQLDISRPKAYGAGAFQLPAFPTGLLYEPPQDQSKRNYAGFATSSQTASTISISNGSDSSDTRPAFAPITSVFNTLDGVRSFLKADTTLAIALHLFDVARGLMGTVSTNVTMATQVNSDHSVEIRDSVTDGVKTVAHLGPGLGDIVSYLKGARFLWTMNEGDVTLTLIDFDQHANAYMTDLLADYHALQAQPAGTLGAVGLPLDAVSMLLSLDPSDLGSFDSGRYTYVTTISPAGDITHLTDHTVTTTDRQSQLTSKTTVTNYNAGWLSEIGIGMVQRDGSTQTSISQSTSVSLTQAQTSHAEFLLTALPGEHYAVDVYFDKIFGTYFFRRVVATPPILYQP